MPLGPLPTDAAIGFDHIANAIGATFMASIGNVGLINSLTRREHLGGIPSSDEIIEGVKAAKVAAHCVNIMRHPVMARIDEAVSDARAGRQTCVCSGGLFDECDDSDVKTGCARCSFECPLTLVHGRG